MSTLRVPLSRAKNGHGFVCVSIYSFLLQLCYLQSYYSFVIFNLFLLNIYGFKYTNALVIISVIPF